MADVQRASTQPGPRRLGLWAPVVLTGLLSALGVGVYLWPVALTVLVPEYLILLGILVIVWVWTLGAREEQLIGIRLQEQVVRRDVAKLGLFFAGAIGLGFYLMVRIGWRGPQEPVQVMFVSLLWGLAFLTVGGFMGFIFGIPRTLAGSAPDRKAEIERLDGDSAYRVNTNLERVSDWITQIIVGGTLTQLAVVPEWWDRIGRYFAANIGQAEGTRAQLTGSASAFFFVATGFLASYLVTRLYLAAAIQRADGVGGEKIRQLSNLSLPELETLENTPLYYGDETPPFSPRAKEVANKVLNLPLDALTSWRDIRVWAKAKLAHGEFADANSGYVRALELAPADAELYLGYAIALSGLKTEPSLVLTQLEHARDSLMRSSPRELRKNVYKSLTYAQTFLRKPESFLGVLDTARDYLSVEDARTSAGLLFNVACAYGQAHGWLSEDRSRVLNEKELA